MRLFIIWGEKKEPNPEEFSLVIRSLGSSDITEEKINKLFRSLLGQREKAFLSKHNVASGVTCSVPGYTLKLGMFSLFKAQNLQVNLNTKLTWEGVSAVCLCYGPCEDAGPFMERDPLAQTGTVGSRF